MQYEGARKDGDWRLAPEREQVGASIKFFAEAIMNRIPVAAVRLNPRLLTKLENIINRALEKNRLRYQHASDMRAELQRLKRDTDSVGLPK